VRIAVTDTGTGPEQTGDWPYLVKCSIRRAHRTRKNVGGLGVGLTVARSLAELHGGGLLAESPGVGKGATFTLWLPQLEPLQGGRFFRAPA